MIDSQDTILSVTNKLKKRSFRVQEKWDTLAIFKDDKLILKKFNLVNNKSDVYATNIPDENQNHSVKKEIEDDYHVQTNTLCKTQKYLTDDTAYTIIYKYFNSFRKSFRIEHQFRDEYWELAGKGEKETPLQKYYRLQFETEELIQEYSFHEEENKDLNRKLCTNIDFKVRNILEKLTNYGIDGYFRQSRTSEVYNLQNYNVTELINNALYSNDKEHLIFKNISENQNNEVIKKSIKLNIDQLSKISQLETRLRKLEIIIGSENLILKRLSCHDKDGLVKAVCSLKELSKLIFFQVNEIESRDINILPKLNQIATKLNDQKINVKEKINKLYETILEANEVSHLLPHIIQRMRILEIFRHKVVTFGVTVDNLTAQFSETSKTLKKNELLLNNIQGQLTKNISIDFFNLQSLSAQIEVLDDQLKNKYKMKKKSLNYNYLILI